jgi:hypothetical protein
MASQLERARKLIRENFRKHAILDGTADQGQAFKELLDIMCASQNPSTEGGGSDGSIDIETWEMLMEALRGIRQISSAFRRVEHCFDAILTTGPQPKKIALKKLPIKKRTRHGDK